MKIIESNLNQELTLPSRGLFNPEIPEGQLIQRCMLVADQKFLSGSNLPAFSALQQVLQRTTITPESFDVGKLTIPDTIYLLFKLRILSYGNTYRFKAKCPECGKRIDIEIDLSDLPVESLDENYVDNLVVQLPNTGDTAYTKVLTNDDLKFISEEVRRRKKKNKDDESEYVLRIVYSIDKIELAKPNADGKSLITHPIDIEKYVNNLTDLDAAYITSSRDSIVYGIDTLVEYTCPECRNSIDINVQFSGDFFRPSISR